MAVFLSFKTTSNCTTKYRDPLRKTIMDFISTLKFKNKPLGKYFKRISLQRIDDRLRQKKKEKILKSVPHI